MVKFINNLMVFLLGLIVLEYLTFIKDYNEMLVLKNYIIYDVKNNNLQTLYNEKYVVTISYEENKINYEIIYNRESLFNFNSFKNIKYNGIIN